MEPALPLPLRLRLEHAPIQTSHEDVSASIQLFLADYAARTGAQTSSSIDDQNAASATAAGGAGSGGASTGGVVASQLTRLMNGLAGRVDYDAFAQLLSGFAPSSAPQSNGMNDDEDEEMDVRTVTEFSPPAAASTTSAMPATDDGEASFSRADELHHDATNSEESHAVATSADLNITSTHSTPSQKEKSHRHKSDEKKKAKRIKNESRTE